MAGSTEIEPAGQPTSTHSFMLMYLNSKLPKPARPRWWHCVILALNFLFFGFFFVNFVYELVTGSALVKF